jgi:Ca2+-binding RTX toxin-like protein
MTMRKLLVIAAGLTLVALSVLVSTPSPVQAAPVCFGRPAMIVGTYGPDLIYGTNFSDVIAALGGNDRVHARGGGDFVCGGAGSDVIFDGYGSDSIDGGTGVDTVYLCPDGAFDRLVSVERFINSSLGCS